MVLIVDEFQWLPIVDTAMTLRVFIIRGVVLHNLVLKKDFISQSHFFRQHLAFVKI
jgi:hypothetical protein